MFMQTEEEAERSGLPKTSCLVGSGEWWSKKQIFMESMALSENGGTSEIPMHYKSMIVYDHFPS
jgi:hypothetical protein